MSILTSRAAVLALALLGGCIRFTDHDGDTKIIGTGNVVTISRSSTGFHSVSLTGLGHLVVIQGDRDAVRLSADDNVVAYMDSSVEQGVLQLRPRSGVKIETNLGVVWYVTVRRLESLHTDGLVTAEAIGIESDQLTIDMEGLSRVVASGDVRRSIVKADGVIAYDGRALMSDECDLDCDGVLTLSIHAREIVHGRACGTGTIGVFGHPAIDVDNCPLVVIRRR